MLFKLLVSSYVGSVVPINTTARLPGKNWTADLLNTTSEAFSNLSEQLEINVSTCNCHLYTLLPNVSWSTAVGQGKGIQNSTGLTAKRRVMDKNGAKYFEATTL